MPIRDFDAYSFHHAGNFGVRINGDRFKTPAGQGRHFAG